MKNKGYFGTNVNTSLIEVADLSLDEMPLIDTAKALHENALDVESQHGIDSRGRQLAEHLKIKYEVFDIASTLEAIGCYRWRDEAIRKVFPQYGAGWKNKIVISGGLEGRVNHFQLVVQSPSGELHTERLALPQYLQIVAATNFKQRIRKTVEYFHADRLNYAVIGTPNRLEYDQGFFVKNGDGSADVKPIAHLYKTQVYQLADELGVPESITGRAPTTDTFPMEQSQEEFYFSMPLSQMDAVLHGVNANVPAERTAGELGLEAEHVQRAYDEAVHRRAATRYLHLRPLLAGDVPEITGAAD